MLYNQVKIWHIGYSIRPVWAYKSSCCSPRQGKYHEVTVFLLGIERQKNKKRATT
jgi:hypothetical protein